MEEYAEYPYVSISDQLAERFNDDLRISQFRVQIKDGIPSLFQLRTSDQGTSEVSVEQLEQEVHQQKELGLWSEWRQGKDAAPIQIIQRGTMVKIQNHAYATEKHIFYVVRKGYWDWPLATVKLPSIHAEITVKTGARDVEVFCHTLEYDSVNFRKENAQL
jgi:hypothetical protein